MADTAAVGEPAGPEPKVNELLADDEPFVNDDEAEADVLACSSVVCFVGFHKSFGPPRLRAFKSAMMMSESTDTLSALRGPCDIDRMHRVSCRPRQSSRARSGLLL